jgi:hypothetical protein
MPAWVNITVADLQAARHAELVDAVQRKAKAVGQVDPVPVAIAKIVNEVLGCVAFSGKYVVDADPTKMAPNLVELCVQKIARTLMPRIGRSLSEDERDEEKTYRATLKDLKNGEWPVDAPATPAATSPVQDRRTRPKITPRTRYFDSTSADGT